MVRELIFCYSDSAEVFSTNFLGDLRIFHYDSSVLRLIRVTACLLHCPRRCTDFFLAQVCKHRLVSVPTLDCLCKSGLVVVELKLWSSASSHCRSDPPFAARTLCLRSSGRHRHEKARHDLSPGSLLAGRVSVESPVPFEVSGQKLLSEGSAFLFNHVVGFVIEVGTGVILCCTHYSVSREKFRSRRADQIIARLFWGQPSISEGLKSELRVRAIVYR